MYKPITGVQAHSGGSVDLAIFAFHLSGISSLLGGCNIITTIINMRAPGLTLHKKLHPRILEFVACSIGSGRQTFKTENRKKKTQRYPFNCCDQYQVPSS